VIRGGGEILHSEILKLIHSILNKEEVPQQWKESIIVPVYKKGDKAGCNNYQLPTGFYPTFFWPG
jgi:hypothetical protein